jgi:hypothetical protein
MIQELFGQTLRRPFGRRWYRCQASDQSVALGSEFPYPGLHGRLDPPPAELRAVLTCPREPGLDALLNYAALKFCKYAEHLEHRLAGSRRRVESLLVKE